MLPVRGGGSMIDRCTGCVGIFLDRGEVEQLIGIDGELDAAQSQQGASVTGSAWRSRRAPKCPRRRASQRGLLGEGHDGGQHGRHHGR